jgi:RNA polymerase sigma factor (sigma-70 family)
MRRSEDAGADGNRDPDGYACLYDGQEASRWSMPPPRPVYQVSQHLVSIPVTLNAPGRRVVKLISAFTSRPLRAFMYVRMENAGDRIRAVRTAARTSGPTSPDLPLGTGSVDSSLTRTFEEFYGAEHGGLFGALFLLTGNRQEAEDVMQEAFLKVWERWDRVKTMENPPGYLYRTAMNAFRMRRRRAAVAARRFVRHLARSEDLERAEARHEVDRALLRLSPRQRAAVVLTELLEFDSNAAGRVLGVKPTTVRKLAQQGREAIRRSVGERDE